MIDPKVFDDLARRLADALPASLQGMQRDLEHNFRSTLQSAFSRMDLVTREEFDAQARVLARTREMVTTLERQVVDLEARLGEGGKRPATTTDTEDMNGG